MSGASLVTKSDGELQRRVRNALFHYRFLTDELEIESVDGRVRLRGSVTSYYARQVLVHGCLRVAGVKEVIDEICVKPKHKRRTD